MNMMRAHEAPFSRRMSERVMSELVGRLYLANNKEAEIE